MHELDTAAQDYACFTNDLYSYQKEIEYEGEVHNLVLVRGELPRRRPVRPREVVAKLMAARMDQFEHIVANELPVLFDELDLDDDCAGR